MFQRVPLINSRANAEGQRLKVKVGQRLLTRSFSGKALAVKRVTENHGKRTPGVDGQTWNTPEQKARAIQALRPRGYRSRPLKRVYLAKPNGKLRPRPAQHTGSAQNGTIVDKDAPTRCAAQVPCTAGRRETTTLAIYRSCIILTEAREVQLRPAKVPCQGRLRWYFRVVGSLCGSGANPNR